MKRLFANPRMLVLLLTVLAGLVLSGCSTTDLETDNQSVRPWNAPQGWENGIPSTMTQGR